MDIHLTGIPVRSWHSLRWPIRRKVEELVVAELVALLSYGDEVRVTFHGAYGKEGPILLAIDASPSVRLLDSAIMEAVHKELRFEAESSSWVYRALCLVN